MSSGHGRDEEVFTVRCMGRTHEVAVRKGSLRFADHSAKELELLLNLGERKGCAAFLREFRLSDIWSDIALRAQSGNWAYADWAERELGKIMGLDKDGANRFLRLAVRNAAVRESREAVKVTDPLLESRGDWGPAALKHLNRVSDAIRASVVQSGLDLGLPVRILWFGIRWKQARSLRWKEELGSSGADVALFLGLDGLAEKRIVDRKLVLRRDGRLFEVLWLAGRARRARAVRMGERLVVLSPRRSVTVSEDISVEI